MRTRYLAVLPVLGLTFLAHAGIAVTNVARSVYARSCGTTRGGTFCDENADSNYAPGSWEHSSLTSFSGSGYTGTVYSAAQSVQQSTATNEKIEASMSILNSISSTGDTFGSAEAMNAFEVRWTTPVLSRMHLATTITGDGWSIIVIGFSGRAEERSAPLYSNTYMLAPGEWVLRIEIGRGPACGPCAISTSDTLSASVTCDFCPADFNGDTMVDDADFSLFAAAYNDLLCPESPASCLSDLNGDGYVDDTDFPFFVEAYNTLICP